ncbi:hypothetical protein SFRURICE_008872 [Spodoptera frugiperda]|nr:hypothetical protein SFRURICE_008872 [Spodoptera frugiperda]
MTMHQDFTFVSIATINLMQNLKRIQDTLIDTISEVYHGQISLHILTPAQLKRELQIIYGQMPKDLVLPIDNVETDLQHIYKLLKTKAKVTETYIIFEITLPLIARESFQVYKILSVPQENDNSMSNQIELAANILIPELDQINHIVKIKIPSDEESPNDILERQGLNKSLSILGEQIKDLKSSKAEIDDISYHDIHHYTIGYILLTIAISGAAVWTWRRYCSLPSRRRGGEACQRQESSATAPKTISDVYSEVQPRMQTNS